MWKSFEHFYATNFKVTSRRRFSLFVKGRDFLQGLIKKNQKMLAFNFISISRSTI
jgi:hypothetical protein